MEISILIIIVILGLIIKLKSKKYSYEREYRKCESPIEQMLFKKLFEEGFKPYSQVPCGKFRIDIGIYYKGKKIAIECDGEKFHSTPEQKEHDRKKDIYLKKHRWNVYRFTGKEIYNDANWCIEVIKRNR